MKNPLKTEYPPSPLEHTPSMLTISMEKPIVTLKLGSVAIIGALVINMLMNLLSFVEALFQPFSSPSYIPLLQVSSLISGLLGIIGYSALAAGYAWYFVKTSPPKDRTFIAASIGLLLGVIIPMLGQIMTPPPSAIEEFPRYLGILSLYFGLAQATLVLSFGLIWREQQVGVTPIVVYHGLLMVINLIIAITGLSFTQDQFSLSELQRRLALPYLFRLLVIMFGIVAYIFFLLKVDVLKLPRKQRMGRSHVPMIPVQSPSMQSMSSTTFNPQSFSKTNEKVIQCPSCNAVLPPDEEMRFCMECGASLV